MKLFGYPMVESDNASQVANLTFGDLSSYVAKLPVIASPHMTETIERKVVRHFRPWQRRGKNRDVLTKTYYFGFVQIPMQSYIVSNGIAIMHPVLYQALRREIQRLRDLHGEDVQIGVQGEEVH